MVDARGFVERRVDKPDPTEEHRKLMISDLFVVTTNDITAGFYWLLSQREEFELTFADLIKRARAVRLSKEQTEDLCEWLKEEALRYGEVIPDEEQIERMRSYG